MRDDAVVFDQEELLSRGGAQFTMLAREFILGRSDYLRDRVALAHLHSPSPAATLAPEGHFNLDGFLLFLFSLALVLLPELILHALLLLLPPPIRQEPCLNGRVFPRLLPAL